MENLEEGPRGEAGMSRRVGVDNIHWRVNAQRLVFQFIGIDHNWFYFLRLEVGIDLVDMLDAIVLIRNLERATRMEHRFLQYTRDTI